APSRALTPLRTPSPGDSISTTALSVSISRSVSPFATRSPSFRRHDTTLPVSCAISSAGMTMLIGIQTSDFKLQTSDFRLHNLRRRDHFDDVAVRRRFELARRRQLTLDRHVLRAGDEELFRGESRDHFVARRRHDDLFLDARGAPAVRRRPERLE